MSNCGVNSQCTGGPGHLNLYTCSCLDGFISRFNNGGSCTIVATTQTTTTSNTTTAALTTPTAYVASLDDLENNFISHAVSVLHRQQQQSHCQPLFLQQLSLATARLWLTIHRAIPGRAMCLVHANPISVLAARQLRTRPSAPFPTPPLGSALMAFACH